jgi:hypothetical protein
LAALNHAAFYRWLERRAPNDDEMKLRGLIQWIYGDHLRYG